MKSAPSRYEAGFARAHFFVIEIEFYGERKSNVEGGKYLCRRVETNYEPRDTSLLGVERQPS